MKALRLLVVALIALPLAVLLIVCLVIGCVVSMFRDDDGPWYSP